MTTPTLVNSPLLVDVREVARVGYEGMKQGKRSRNSGMEERGGGAGAASRAEEYGDEDGAEIE